MRSDQSESRSLVVGVAYDDSEDLSRFIQNLSVEARGHTHSLTHSHRTSDSRRIPVGFPDRWLSPRSACGMWIFFVLDCS